MKVKTVSDVGMYTVIFDGVFENAYGLQLYFPIITIRKDTFKASFRTCLVLGGKTWCFDWSAGFEILGFGFGFGKYKK